MKILGVDFGTKRIGIAISDETAAFAFPKAIMPHDGKLIALIRKMLGEERFNLPVIMEKEFMTSMHVSQAFGQKPVARQVKQERGEKRDDSAAALILQRYLDRKKI